MADENLQIGVEYTGAAAIQKFGADLGALPSELGRALEALGVAAGPENAGLVSGKKFVEAFVNAVRLQMAQARGMLSEFTVSGLSPSQIGATVAQAGLSPTRSKESRETAAGIVEKALRMGSPVAPGTEDLGATVSRVNAKFAQLVNLAREFRVATQAANLDVAGAATKAAVAGRILYGTSAEGVSARQVAAQVGVSPTTVQRASADYGDLIGSERARAKATEAAAVAEQEVAARSVALSGVARILAARYEALAGAVRAETIAHEEAARAARAAQYPKYDPNSPGQTEARQRAHALEMDELAADRRAALQEVAPYGGWGARRESAADSRAMREALAAQRAPTAYPGAGGYTGSGGGGLSGFRADFMKGFSGGGKGTAEMIGQTARISLFYGVAYRALSILQEGLAAAVQETLAYEDALTNLNIVTGRARSANEEFANTLANISVAAGYAPSAGVALGSKALGLYGVANADQATQERTVELSARVSTQMARVSGADPIATQTQLAGALRSLGWGAERLPELQDAISYISRQTGQASMELLGATANIATLGTEAGFSPQMLAALVAQVGTTTGQNPESTAGQFRQLLSRTAPEIAAQAEPIVGISLEGMDLQQIFDAVSKLTLTADQLNQFASLFGKGGSQQVATILTQQYGTIQGLATGAEGATGYGQAAYDKAMTSINNRLKQLGATFADFGLTLVESGLLDWLAAVVVILQKTVEAGATVLDWFNLLPRGLRSVAFALGEAYAAALLLSRSNLAAKIAAFAETGLGRAMGAGGVAKVAAGAETRAATVVAGGLNTSALAGMIPMFMRSSMTIDNAARVYAAANGGLLNYVKASTGLSGAGMTAVAGGAAAALALANLAYQTNEAAESMVTAAEAAALNAATISQMRDAAAKAGNDLNALEQQGYQGMSAPGDFGDFLGNFFKVGPATISELTTGNERTRLAEIQNEQTARADEEQAIRDAAVAAQDATAIFNDFSAEGLASTMSDLTDRGFDAQQRLTLLNQAMFDFVGATQDAIDITDVAAHIPEVDFGGVSTRIGEGIADAIPNMADLLGAAANQELPSMTATPTFVASESLGLSSDDLSALQQQIVDADLAYLTDNIDEAGNLTKAGFDGLVQKNLDLVHAAIGEAGWQGLIDSGNDVLLKGALDGVARGVMGDFAGAAARKDVLAYLQALPEYAQASGAQVTARTGSEAFGRGETLRQLEIGRRGVLATATATGRPLTDEELRWLALTDAQIAQTKRAVVEDRIEEISALGDLQQSYLSDTDVFGRLDIQQGVLTRQRQEIEAQIARDENRRFIPGARFLGPVATGAADLTARRENIEAQNALDREEAARTLQAQQNQALAGLSGADALGRARQAMRNAKSTLDAFTENTSPEYWAAFDAWQQAKSGYAQSEVQNAQANRLANIDPRNTLARLRAQITGLREQMALVPANQRGEMRDQVNGLNQQIDQYYADLAGAYADLAIAGNRSETAKAENSLGDARRNLGLQLAGTKEYANALTGVIEAERALADAKAKQADRLRRLASDLTDPVAQARLDVQQMLDQLNMDLSTGQGTDVITEDQLNVRKAQNTAEQAAFQQRISDLQTAEDLGRISHAAYISYLQGEHDRLSMIANKTRQQQEELDQVDKLLKSVAEELQGQFNIGDIKLPTIYEVRRAMESGAPTAVQDYSYSNNVININGASFEQVVEWLMTYTGPNAQVLTGSSGRRV